MGTEEKQDIIRALEEEKSEVLQTFTEVFTQRITQEDDDSDCEESGIVSENWLESHYLLEDKARTATDTKTSIKDELYETHISKIDKEISVLESVGKDQKINSTMEDIEKI